MFGINNKEAKKEYKKFKKNGKTILDLEIVFSEKGIASSTNVTRKLNPNEVAPIVREFTNKIKSLIGDD